MHGAREPRGSGVLMSFDFGVRCPMTRRTKPPRRAKLRGTYVIWRAGLCQRYGITHVSLWRWEKAGKLPPRDVFIGGRALGWRLETILRAEAGIV